MQVYTLNLAPTNVSTNNICTSHSPGAGAIVLAGTLVTDGVATCGAAQTVKLTSGGNDSGITFTVIGTDADGEAQSETVTGANASNVDTTKYFKTVTSITHTGSVAGTLIVGTNVASVSPMFKFYKQVSPARVAVGISLVSGSMTYTLDDCFTGPPHTLWIANATVAAKTGSFEYAYIDTPCMAARVRATASSTGVLQANFVIAKA